MKYKSKKDPKVIASYDFQDPKTKTIRMIYLTGDKAGNSFEVSSSTLKRWWSKVDADDKAAEAEIINTPYKPNVTPHYIPKPESVIRYEENKKKARRNIDIPEFDAFVEEFEQYFQKVNTNSSYVMLKDSKTTIWRKARWIDVYADQEVWERLVAQGFESKPNKDKERPFSVRVSTVEEYDKLRNVIIN